MWRTFWSRKKPKSPPPSPKPDHVKIHYGRTLAQWQDNEALVAEARALAAQPIYQEMLSVMHAERSAVYRGTASDATSQLIALGKIKGYDRALWTLEQLVNYAPKTVELPPPDFGAEEILNNDYGYRNIPTRQGS